MNVAAKTIKVCFCKTLRKNLEIGIICVLHPFGRDLVFKPHVHVVVTNGGFTRDNQFVKLKYISYDSLHRRWQYYLLMELKKYVSKRIIDYCFDKYPRGFAAYIKPEIIYSGKKLVRYVGRYLRHPAIANSRITFYNGKFVEFYYMDNKTKNQINSRMKVDDFISAIIQHIPEKNFKLIRYYGLYSRKGKKKKLKVMIQSSLKQMVLFDLPNPKGICCLKCGNEMIFVSYFKDPPDDLDKRVWAGDFN
jgi:hypothetical protein